MLNLEKYPNHLRVVSPTWPLQNTVAVNPFWNQIDTQFNDVMREMESLIHAPLFMPMNYYLEKYKNGKITDEDIADALKSNGTVADFVTQSRELDLTIKKVQCFTDFLDLDKKTNWGQLFSFELSKYAAGYFDSGQALAQFPFKKLSFLDAWLQSQAYDHTFEVAGLKNFRKYILIFNGLNSSEVIKSITQDLKMDSKRVSSYYLGRLSVTVMGWASQFCYHEWQKKLGYKVNDQANLEDFIAVRMILDFALLRSAEEKYAGIVVKWLDSFNEIVSSERLSSGFSKFHSLWQETLEIHEQKSIGSRISTHFTSSEVPHVQIAMCIDVRSELFRRAIENQSKSIETIGFAGFFGLPFDFEKIDEKVDAHRLPVLLSPAFKVKEKAKQGSEDKIKVSSIVQSYFRNLRKAPLSSFLYVELFGIFSLKQMLLQLWKSLGVTKSKMGIPERFSDQKTRPSQSHAFHLNGEAFSFDNKVDRAFGVLTHMGLKTRFSRLLVIAGHGSATTNNAFNSSLDCGACGGHAGDINARFLCDLLNDSKVRASLEQRGIAIPQTSYFLAAIHETVNDELYLLDEEQVPESHQNDLHHLKLMLVKAGEQARAERQTARSAYLDSSASRRSKNWSEVRPEWGLAGNSAFIVAPRSFTKSENFSSRIFLHDYQWRDDENFKTLELIMTAPMVVTNWINMQYYASTVAPQVFGAGNKTLHNLVNESGVVEGNGGDLRIGLPWQSVHDGEQFVHDPLRLAVFIAAPIEEIEKVIQTHATVKNLVDHQWLTLHQINESTHTIFKRKIAGVWEEF